MMDLEEELSIAYVSNGLKTGMGELTRTYRHLRDAVYDCLEKDKLNKTEKEPSPPSFEIPTLA